MRMITRLALLALAAWTTTGLAHAGVSAPLQVHDAWIRVLPGALPNAGYANLTNPGNHEVKLVAARSNAYAKVMLHESSESGGISRMHAVDHLSVPAHGSVRLAPGGYHLMLMHAVHPVKVGSRVTITLRFADGRTQDASFLARPANASGVND
jgi:copper(I)-binding protein